MSAPSSRVRELAIACDSLRLGGGACVPEEPRGVVVLLHGIPSTAPPDPGDRGYPGLAEAFALRRWIAVWADMRGVRSSEGFFSIGGWVRDARAAIDAARELDEAAGLPVALVGSSAGGAVSIEAARRGAPADALVLLAAPAAWLSFAADPAAGVVRITREAGMPVASEVLDDPAAWAAEFADVTAERSIADVTIPTLIVHGTHDDVVPLEHARRLARAAPEARLEIIEGAGHQLRREPAVLELVLGWLEATLPAPSKF